MIAQHVIGKGYAKHNQTCSTNALVRPGASPGTEIMKGILKGRHTVNQRVPHDES